MGTWPVNIAFEDEAWTWSGTAKTLTLKPCRKKTLTWNGNVPEDAPIDSVARLIVYYDDSFEPLDWWIHVIDGAELNNNLNHSKIANPADLRVYVALEKSTHLLVKNATAEQVNIGDIGSFILSYSSSIFQILICLSCLLLYVSFDESSSTSPTFRLSYINEVFS